MTAQQPPAIVAPAPPSHFSVARPGWTDRSAIHDPVNPASDLCFVVRTKERKRGGVTTHFVKIACSSPYAQALLRGAR